MLNHAFMNECLQAQNDVDQVQSTPNDVARTLAILPCGKHQLKLRTCPPELLLFVQPRTTPFGLKENGAFNFHGSVVPGDVLSRVSRRLTCPSTEGEEKSVFMCNSPCLWGDLQVVDRFSSPGGSSSATTPSALST